MAASPKRAGTVIATKAGISTRIALTHGQNSLGEPGVFAGLRPGRKAEFAGLRGYPLYAMGIWLVGHGYEYTVESA